MTTMSEQPDMRQRKEEVLLSFAAGLLSGVSPEEFVPKDTPTRKQVEQHGVVFVGVGLNRSRGYFVCCVGRCGTSGLLRDHLRP
jgi:hypothetical protein